MNDKPSAEDLQELGEALFPGSWPKAEPSDNTVKRQWGYYKVLHEGDGFSVKELTILPGKSLSDQRHFKRDEHWLVVKGKLVVELESYTSSEHCGINFLDTNHEHYSSSLFIPRETWHWPRNKSTEEVKVIETWIGDSSEEDIERRNV